MGPNLAEPRLVPGSRELIDDLIVAHYEALDREAGDTGSAEVARRLAASEPVRVKPVADDPASPPDPEPPG